MSFERPMVEEMANQEEHASTVVEHLISQVLSGSAPDDLLNTSIDELASVGGQLKAKTKNYLIKNFLNLEMRGQEVKYGSQVDVKWEDGTDKDGYPFVRYVLRVNGKVFSVVEKHIFQSAPTGVR